MVFDGEPVRHLKVLFLIPILVILLLTLGACSCTTYVTTPTPTVAHWPPDQAKVLFLRRDQLEPQIPINIPPGDYLIVSFSVDPNDHVSSIRYHVTTSGTENYIDFWVVDSKGNLIGANVRNYQAIAGYGDGLSEGTYYIYLSNEFTVASDKEVYLSAVWQ